jgi:hypothetical protein
VSRFVSRLLLPGFALFLALGLSEPAAAQACPNECSGNGLCFVDECLCSDGWTGADCSVPAGGPVCPNACSGHGTCGAEGCVCEAGYTGEACDVAVPAPATGPLTGTWTVEGGMCEELDMATGEVEHYFGSRVLELGLVSMSMSHAGDVTDAFFGGLPFVGFAAARGPHAYSMAGAQCTDVAAQPAAFLHVVRAVTEEKKIKVWKKTKVIPPHMDVRFTQSDATRYRHCWLRLERTDASDPGVMACPFGP